jgi:hypothetical protein
LERALYLFSAGIDRYFLGDGKIDWTIFFFLSSQPLEPECMILGDMIVAFQNFYLR